MFSTRRIDMHMQHVTHKPTVSVLMSVYNDERFVAEAIQSVLGQTGPDFEFIIVDDAGVDGSSAILRSYRDERITLISHSANKGLAASLNHGLQYCRGEYIARQDGDDVSEPLRIQSQVAYLQQHPEIAYVGTGVTIIDEDGIKVRTCLFPEDPDEIRASFSRLRNPLPHGSLMFRREAIESVEGYDEGFRTAEDHDLHLRLLEHFSAASIRKPLIRLRMRKSSMQFADRSSEGLKGVLFAHARQLARRKYGTLPGDKEASLRSAVAEWFQCTSLARCWNAALSRRMAVGSIRAGRLWEGSIKLLRAIAEDPKWLPEYIACGERMILTAKRRRELESIIDGLLKLPG